MSFPDTIELTDALAATQEYVAAIKNSTSTIRRDPARPIDQTMALKISHETSKDKSRVNTAVMLDKTVLDSGDSVTLGNARVLAKISYDVNQLTEADIQEMVAEIVEFLTEANITKLLNQEH
jgi:hypothetical protein